MEKLNRAQKCSILGPQNLGSRGGPGPPAPPGSAPDKPLTIQLPYDMKNRILECYISLCLLSH